MTTCIPETNSPPKFFAVDLYCGAGGTTRGLMNAGGYIIAGIDKDSACRATYQRNNRNEALDLAVPTFLNKDMFPASRAYPGGQQGEIREALERLIPHYLHQCPMTPLLFAICAPCQSFTRFVQPGMTAQKAADRDRDQNLLSQASAFIEYFAPDLILSENVAGIEKGKYGYIWKEFKEKLRQLGYQVGSNEVWTSEFGIGQRRRRSIIIAVKVRKRSLTEVDLKVPTRDEDARQLTVREVIGELERLQAGERYEGTPNHQCRNLSNINRRRLLSVEPGEPNFNFPDELRLPCHVRLKERGERGFGDVYTRIHPDRPAPTITTRFHSVSNGRFGHYDETQARGLSLHEGALLQSFPENYTFYGTNMDNIAKMIGNAVPPRLAEYMATYLLTLWLEGFKTGNDAI